MRLSDVDHSAKGVYSLLIQVATDLKKKIGQLGKNNFTPGLYVYTGSAIGPGGSSLSGRLSRHFSARKKNHWHIDHLLSSEKVHLKGAVYAVAGSKMECKVNLELVKAHISNYCYRGFGSSDCRSGCAGHLVRLPVVEVKQAFKVLLGTYSRCFLTPVCFVVG